MSHSGIKNDGEVFPGTGERVRSADCRVVDTPLGEGVLVGLVVYTQFGSGSFVGVEAAEHQDSLERLLAEAQPGKLMQIVMAPFALHLPPGRYTIFKKAVEE